MEFLSKLPVSSHFEEIKRRWSEFGNFAIKSPTGSGKSLGIPLFFLREKLVSGKILVVQPRRVAARSLARTACRICNCELGQEIGYKVRLDSKVSSKTKIIYITDGMVFRFLQHPENLKDVDLIIFDEFHERTLFMDASLALAKFLIENEIIKAKIFVTSATLDLKKVSNYLGPSDGLAIDTQSFPVKLTYKAIQPKKSLQVQICDHLKWILPNYEGDILIFMDGASEIKKTVREIENKFHGHKLKIFALFGEMSPELQDFALTASIGRKIIVSTNLAETSLTIEGIKIVIDTGLAKKYRFDPYRKVNVLLSEPVSKSSASQRAGRAGRLSEGFCLRMWSANEHDQRQEFDEPEVCRLDLTEIYLKLASVGVNPNELNWYELPPVKRLENAEKFLHSIDAIDEQCKTSLFGNQLARLPVHPRIGFALILAKEKNCLAEFSLICAALDFKNPIDFGKRLDLVDPKKVLKSDILALLIGFNKAKESFFNVTECRQIGVHARRYQEIENHARLLCESLNETFNEPKIKLPQIVEILLSVYPERLAYLENEGTNSYRDVNGLKLQLAQDSLGRNAKWLLPLKVLEKKKQGRIVLEMDEVTVVTETDIRNFLGEKISLAKEVYLDTSTHQVFLRSIEKVGNVIVSRNESSEVTDEQRAEAYFNAIIGGELKLKNWNNAVDHLISRINFIANAHPEYEIQSFGEGTKECILKEICSTYKKWKEIKNANVLDFIHTFYGQDIIALLDKAVPEKFNLVTSKKQIVLRYENGKAYLAAPIQKLYDLENHPNIVFGNCLVMVEILAPNGRVVQCTDDIIGFWEKSYPSIKKELAGRYPKHEWR